MRIAYANAIYRRDTSSGGNAHIGQFITNAVALGHEVWTWPKDQHPAACRLPASRFARWKNLRRMDVLYVRVEWYPPSACRAAIAPLRSLIGSPVVVWEFNASPEFGRVIGRSEDEIGRAIEHFKRFGRGCDLAVCVSRTLAEYVGEHLSIQNTLSVPNGSDTDLFRRDISSVKRVGGSPDQLNVVWIGSGDLSWHNLDLLLEAAGLLWDHERRSQIVFHIIGRLSPGTMRNMTPNVHFHGPELYEELPHWLAAMDVGLCLYHPGPADSNSPLKLFDYMASELTVVGTFHPQIRRVFNELGQPDLLVSPDDPDTLANILLGLAGDRGRVREQGNAGRKLIIDSYSWRRAVRDTIGGDRGHS